MISYLKILSHRAQSQDCSLWCYQDALSGAAPLELNGVSGCELLNGSLQFLHQNELQTIALPLVWNKSEKKEPWASINSFWVLRGLPFRLWLLFIWGDKLCIAVAWESRSWDTFLFAGLSLCQRARELVSRGYKGHFTVSQMSQQPMFHDRQH